MKETPWTPGPWQLCDRGDYGDFDGNSRVICAPDNDEYLGMRLAVVQVSDGDFFEESEANARLMNAAPEMAEALCEILGALAWINTQAENAMVTSAAAATESGDSSGALQMLNSIASDIGINAMMQTDEVHALLAKIGGAQ